MRIMPILLIVLFLLGLCGCKATGGTTQAGEPLDITAFSFTHQGSSTDQCYRYTATQEGDSIRLHTEELFSGGLVIDTLITEPLLEQLGEIAGTYRLDRWDGFDKTKGSVADGSGFSLSITLADGKTISARGSNKFPDGYADAKGEIKALFETLIDQYS